MINTATNTVTKTIPVGGGPVDVAISPDGARAYVTNAFDDTVSVLNVSSVQLNSVAVQAVPADLLAASPVSVVSDVASGLRGLLGWVAKQNPTHVLQSGPGHQLRPRREQADPRRAGDR